MQVNPIGSIYTEFTDLAQMPIQPTGAAEVPGVIEIDQEYQEGLKNLDGFSHIILIYQFHKTTQCSLTVTPFLDKQPRGVFSTRAPVRPNPIGISIVEIKEITGNRIHIVGADILDGTPVIDIKPYVPKFDHPTSTVRCGWLDETAESVGETRSDTRFLDETRG